MDIMLQEFSGYELPDELEEKYRKLFSDMMKQVKYTVAEAKEVENKNFTVDVKVEPMLIFNDTYQELQKQTEDYATQVSNEVMNGASLPSETDMQTHVLKFIMIFAELSGSGDEIRGSGDDYSTCKQG